MLDWVVERWIVAELGTLLEVEGTRVDAGREQVREIFWTRK